MSKHNSKSECLKIYFKLRQQEYIIDKSIETYIQSCKIYPEQWRDIIQDIDRFEYEYKKLADGLRKRVIEIYQELKTVRFMTLDENVSKINIESFQNKLQDLWKKIQEFKDYSQKSQHLIEEQSSLESDLNSMIKVIQKHKNFSSDDTFFHCKPSNSNVQSQKHKLNRDFDYEEVEDFSTLLAKTGHTGNWSQEDHLLYLKLRKKYNNLPALVRAILAKCPDLTKESIINHDVWYKTYLELRSRQKAAVREWRERKESMRLTKLASKQDSSPTIEVPQGPPKKSIKTVGLTGDVDSKELKKIEEEKKKELVKQWREKKESEKAAEQEKLKNLAKARQKDQENRRRKRDAEIKRMLAEHKENKIAKEEEAARDIIKSYSNSSFILQFYRERDQQFIEKRKNLALSKVNESYKKTPKQSLTKSHESLIRETKDWLEKPQKIEHEIDLKQPISFLRDFPRRSAVSWKSYYEIPETIFY